MSAALPTRPVLQRELLLADRLPYTAHVAEQVVATRAGDYVQALSIGGTAFESVDDALINVWHERLNILWRNVASPQVALWAHVVRRRAEEYPAESFPAGFARELADRYRTRLAGERLYVNELYLAVVYRPPVPALSAALSRVGRRTRIPGAATPSRTGSASTPSLPPNPDRRDADEALEVCGKLREQLSVALDRCDPEWLGVYSQGGTLYSSLLEYFGLLVNGERQRMPLPWQPVHDVLGTSRPCFGTELLELRAPTQTRLGAMLGIKEYPAQSSPGMLNGLLKAPFPFVLTQSFSFLPKATAQGLLARQYHRLQNAGDLAVSQTEELRAAQDALAGNEFVMGDHHLSLQVQSEPFEATLEADPQRRVRALNDSLARARQLLADTGMVVAREDLALEAAFWAQLPGNHRDRPRVAPITSRNFAALAPWHNYPTGRIAGNHWGAPVMTLMTSAGSPLYLSLHASDPRDPSGGSRKDTGHTFICGPTGSGKTVFLGFAVARLLQHGATQVVFDKDRGLDILVRALGGCYLPLAFGMPTGCNPLQLPDGAAHRGFLRDWLEQLTTPPSRLLTAREQREVAAALDGVLALAPADRSLSRVLEFLDPTVADGPAAALRRWCASAGGEYAWVFDGGPDRLVGLVGAHTLLGFDMTQVLERAAIRGPLTAYLFHVVRQRLDGRRLVVWMDEFAKLACDPAFEAFARDGLKTWRKLNGVAAFATQSPSDVIASPIARTLIEQTATQIFFPNPTANRDEYVQGFGLTEREFRLIREELTPGGRQFLFKQGHWSQVCTLDLKGFDYELDVISGRIENVQVVEALMAEHGADPAAWLPVFRERCRARLTSRSAEVSHGGVR